MSECADGMAYKTLVACEDATDRSKLVELLSEAGYRVVGAASFDEAAHLVTSIAPNLLVTEIRMGQLASDDWARRKGTQWAILKADAEAKMQQLYP